MRSHSLKAEKSGKKGRSQPLKGVVDQTLLIERYLKEMKEGLREHKLNAVHQFEKACEGADFVVVATPTDFDRDLKSLDISSVENTIDRVLKRCVDATIVIRSTLPIGCVEKLIKEKKTNRLIYSPEFLRESSALYDCLNPSRIVIGAN